MILLSLGFGLGVLAVVLAMTRPRKTYPIVVDGDCFAGCSPRAREEAARELLTRLNYQDSTLP